MKKIVFYDGDCGFCNGAIQFILSNERNPEINFAPLQSEFTIAFFKEHQLAIPNLSTFYFWDGQKMWDKSTGALHVAGYLKFPYPMLKAGYILPKFLRNKLYDFVANRRHKLSNGFCVLPTPEQKLRFIH